MRRALVAAGSCAALWGLHGVLVASAPHAWLGRTWSLWWVHGSLAALLIAAVAIAWRSSLAKRKLVVLLAALALPSGSLLRFASGWQTTFITPLSCRAPLADARVCTGFDESFQESYAARLARGGPRESDCKAFAAAAATAHAGPASEKVTSCAESSPSSWRVAPCHDLGLPAAWSCYTCDAQASYEESSAKLFAFAPDCRAAVWFHGENVGRDTAVQWLRDGRLN